MSKRGQNYASASKHRIPNEGQQKTEALTNEHSRAHLTFQVADVSRPLLSVGSTCDQDNIVIFGVGGGTILNLVTGSTMQFDRINGIYELDFWMKEEDTNSSSDFPRPGHM